MHLFAVGDIHGCFDKLKELMDILPVKDSDTIVFLGDYVDRGSQSREVVEYLIALKNERAKGETVFLRGNHERMFLDYLDGAYPGIFLANGGAATLKSYDYENRGKIPQKHRDFLLATRLYYQTGDYIFVHAGLKPGIPLEQQTESDMLWIRDEFIRSEFDFGKKVIYGHTNNREFVPNYGTNRIGIDTGAVYGGLLTAIRLPDEKLYQA